MVIVRNLSTFLRLHNHAEARASQVRAEAESDREKLSARRDVLLVEAEGQKALHAAENMKTR